MRRLTTTCSVQVFMAGDIGVAKQRIREAAFREGMCVTVTPTTFIYTGGEEEGFVVGFQNYPRFPSEPESLVARATAVAELLMSACCQRMALVVAPDRTEWLTVEPPGAAK